MLWELLFTFLIIGLVSFGGGYAVIPLIQYEVTEKGWLTTEQLQEAITLAGMAPGPIATNTATLIGYQTKGTLGAIFSTLGMVLPSLVIIIALAAFFYRVQHNRWVKSSFYGLRPIIAGLIFYAAIHFGFMGQHQMGFSWFTIGTLVICGASLFLLFKYKLHPLLLILVGAAAGIVLF
ncbi:chromate transporter [Paenibacillus sp. MDMC362]|uniref:chromate transporter n=1 Tax=Paenibacillus sp. MDMC362 TaxID=2977365 RepID=UPI000DC43683|nr:chromate transporter [Paenibacillus sp. MDMC362]RAR44690.1 chromate transporter [Paenibacillus sp. MDMC362]